MTKLIELGAMIDRLNEDEMPVIGVNIDSQREEIERYIQSSKSRVYIILDELQDNIRQDFIYILETYNTTNGLKLTPTILNNYQHVKEYLSNV